MEDTTTTEEVTREETSPENEQGPEPTQEDGSFPLPEDVAEFVNTLFADMDRAARSVNASECSHRTKLRSLREQITIERTRLVMELSTQEWMTSEEVREIVGSLKTLHALTLFIGHE